MKKMMNTMMDKANAMGIKAKYKMMQCKAFLFDNSGEAYLDLVIKILLCVVLGALLLAGLYALFGDLVMPTLTRRIQEMFDYAG